MVNGFNDGKNFLILDLETTGLDPRECRIIEVAWTTTKGDLAMPMSVFSRVLGGTFEQAALEIAEPIVQEMHTATGLRDEMLDQSAEPYTLREVEDEILDHLNRRSSEGETWHLLGASVHFDRSFIDFWMPRLSKRLHHRILDTSSLKLIAGAAGLEIPKQVNPLSHRAANDVREALGYAQTFRDLLKTLVTGSDVSGRVQDPKVMKGFL